MIQPRSPLRHAGREAVAEVGDGGDHHLDEGAVVGPRGTEEPAGQAVAGVVDQRVDDQARARDLVEDRAGGGRVGQVGGDDVHRAAMSARSSAASASSRSARRAVSTRSNPLAANTLAIAAPIPADAPVTSAVLFAIFVDSAIRKV